MHPQRNVIHAAQMINEIALVTQKDEGPKDYDYDKHENDLHEYKSSDEYKEMRRNAFKGGPNMDKINQINSKLKEIHPMGYHVGTASAEIDNYRLGKEYQNHSGDERLSNMVKIADRHFDDYKKTMTNHPVYGSEVDHHRRTFIDRLSERTSR